MAHQLRTLFLLAFVTLLSLSSVHPASAQEGMKELPFSLTAGVPTGEASIGVLEPVFEVNGIPNNLPMVFLSPGEDSYITQTILTPQDLAFGTIVLVEVYLSSGRDSLSTTEGPVRIAMTMTARTAGINSEYQDILRLESTVQVRGERLEKVSYMIPTPEGLAGSELLTIQVGRKAKDNPEDSNPGIVRVEAVRIAYAPPLQDPNGSD